MADAIVHVMAGAVFDASRRVLIAQRPPGKHMAGGWEFPGGKVEPGEQPLEALIRELQEELAIKVIAAQPLIAYKHTYPHRDIFLDLWHVTHYEGTPSPAEGQPLKWAHVKDLAAIGLLPADLPMVPALKSIV